MPEGHSTRIELTFVPMRNVLFLTIALNHALSLGMDTVVFGACKDDAVNYPDCRASFFAAFEVMACKALQRKVQILTPLINMIKADIVRLARQLPGCWDALAYTHTAYDDNALGKDHASVLRAQGFLEAGEVDPLTLREHS